jgi:hypothetical protein
MTPISFYGRARPNSRGYAVSRYVPQVGLSGNGSPPLISPHVQGLARLGQSLASSLDVKLEHFATGDFDTEQNRTDRLTRSRGLLLSLEQHYPVPPLIVPNHVRLTRPGACVVGGRKCSCRSLTALSSVVPGRRSAVVKARYITGSLCRIARTLRLDHAPYSRRSYLLPMRPGPACPCRRPGMKLLGVRPRYPSGPSGVGPAVHDVRARVDAGPWTPHDARSARGSSSAGRYSPSPSPSRASRSSVSIRSSDRFPTTRRTGRPARRPKCVRG